ncbi:hypothetical protein [Jiella pacifica]|uniref:Uncharacterized protein n=1 Tax=Jiella pacifica TaxID=2696469 RepID=A0A6N9T713_9HYPH|nr:hypothetical protein [Jiella pacifica]NDW05866.1 hypothetical protein [Jiella pacifica]
MGAQLGPYFYFDGLGNRRKHYFDAETIGPNGEWCLYAVKSRLSSKYAVTVEILKRLHEDDERLAEATLHIVDEDCRKVWQVQRARLVLTARQFVDDDAEAAVLACLASEDREFTVAEVDERTALDHRTLYAVARLYWKRRVTVRDGLFLDYAAHIRAA